MGVVHWSVSARLATWTLLFVLSKCNLLLLLLVLCLSTEFGIEVGFVVFGKVLAVGVCDGYVVEEASAAQNEPLFPGGSLAKELKGVISKDAHYHFVEFFRSRGRASMTTRTLSGVRLAFFGIKGGGFEDNAFFAAGLDGSDIGICPDVHTFGFEVIVPVPIELF